MYLQNVSYLPPHKKIEVSTVVTHALDISPFVDTIILGGSYSPGSYRKAPYPSSPVIELIIIALTKSAAFELETLWSWDKTMCCGWYKPSATSLRLHVKTKSDYLTEGIRNPILKEVVKTGVVIYSAMEDRVQRSKAG